MLPELEYKTKLNILNNTIIHSLILLPLVKYSAEQLPFKAWQDSGSSPSQPCTRQDISIYSITILVRDEVFISVREFLNFFKK